MTIVPTQDIMHESSIYGSLIWNKFGTNLEHQSDLIGYNVKISKF